MPPLPRHLPLMIALAVLTWALIASPSLVEIAAGVAIFLFGMMSLEQGFKAFTGGTLERLLKASTNRLWKSLTFGALATTLTQSSSLVSVITISFLSAGLIGLAQGIGVIFGANLGTTTGAWLVAGFGLKVNISAYAMPLITFGVVLMFNRSKSLKGLGYVLAGVGFLFLGIHYMKEGFEAYQDAIDLSQFAIAGLAGLLIYTGLGIVATVVMQSSHATLVLTITALSAGHISYENALALSIGANVGTTITAMLGAISANIEGRRLAGAHLIFNLVTGLVALIFIQFFLMAVDIGSGWLGIRDDNHTLKLALFHTLFNLAGIVLMMPFIKQLVVFLERHMQPKAAPLDQPKFINATMLEMPGAAIEASRRELLRLFHRVFSLMAQILQYEPAQLRRFDQDEQFKPLPERLRAVEVDDVYARRIKPLHGLILNFLARLSVEGKRADQLLTLRQASQHLMQAVKDAKHLQKNLVRYLASANPYLQAEYAGLRYNIGRLLNRIDQLGNDDIDPSSVEIELAELSAFIDSHDIVANGRLDQLIRDGKVTTEQASSLMNDNSYAYRLSRNLLAMSRACLLPFEEVDVELREQLSLDAEEVRDTLDQQGLTSVDNSS